MAWPWLSCTAPSEYWPEWWPERESSLHLENQTTLIHNSDSFIQACSITRGIKEVPSALISRSLSSLSSCASRFWCLNIRSRTLARRVRFCPHTWAKALITCSSFRRTSWKTSHIICWNEFYNKQLLIIIYLPGLLVFKTIKLLC